MRPAKKVKVEEPQEEEVEQAKPRARPITTKCVKCKTRQARKGCTQEACFHCCTSTKTCEAHADSRVHKKYTEDLLLGQTDIARRANQKRSFALMPTAFRETGFVYSEQTIKVWDVREFMANQKWKEDAIRKSQKRKAREISSSSTTRLKISRKRFHSFIDDSYHKSLES